MLLLERHYMLGGFCSTFRRHGFIFDAATHFYPMLGNPATLTGKLLRRPGNPHRMGEDGSGGSVPFSRHGSLRGARGLWRAIHAKLKNGFPEEISGVDRYFEELRQAYLAGLLYYFRGVANDTMERLERFTMTEKLDEHIRDPRSRRCSWRTCRIGARCPTARRTFSTPCCVSATSSATTIRTAARKVR